MDVIKSADWIIDLGPEGGDEGGKIICSGTPEEVMTCPESATGLHLKHQLDKENEQAQNLIRDMNSESKLLKNTLKKKTARTKAL
jgi:excinuclease ABC subunit A